MNKLTTLAVVVVAACTVTYTIVTMIRNHRRYVRQKEALDRWFSAYKRPRKRGVANGSNGSAEKVRRLRHSICS